MTNARKAQFGEVARTGDGTYIVRFERRLDHRPERVWAALTDPDEARHWYTEMALEGREGGSIHLDFGLEGKAHGTVLTWSPPNLLEHSWQEHGATSYVRWELREDGQQTILSLTHTDLSTESPHEYGAGWHDFLDRLPGHLDGSGSQVEAGNFQSLLDRYRQRLRDQPRVSYP